MNKAIAMMALLVFLALGSLPGEAADMTVQKAQMILKHLNYFPDAVDGSLGPATRKAIRTFQADNDLTLTGRLDAKTCALLQSEEERITREFERKKLEDQTRKAQARLADLGYYRGPVTGRRGDIPQTDLVAFQMVHALTVTGDLDAATVDRLFSAQALPKPAPTPEPDPVTAPPAATPVSAPPSAAPVSRRTDPYLTVAMGGLRYQPRSLYDSTDYEALHQTLNPEQAVRYQAESLVFTRLTAHHEDDFLYVATSRLTGGNNAADALGLSWAFNLTDRPFVVHLDYTQVESDALYGGRRHTIESRSLEAEWLLRYRPGLDVGLNLSHEFYPTLVSCRASDAALRAIRFDEDFQLSTVNLALRYDSLAQGKGLGFSRWHLVPYLTAGLYGGLAMGTVSDGVIDALSRDLGHAFSSTLFRFNVKVSPEVGLIYRLVRKNSTLNITLGYGLSVHWPVWELPMGSDDEEVMFYRRNLSHGPVVGIHMVF
jgi:peptidoglycan hydrolase-like protein with peptidoglycan-binding domain